MSPFIQVFLFFVSLQGAQGLEATATAAAAGKTPDLPWALRSLHKLFDLDHSGAATVDELLNFSRATEVSISTHSAGRMIQGIDTSGDHKVSWEEYFASRFGGAILSPEELKLEKAKFAAIDQDGDGYLSVDEVPMTLFPEQNPKVLKKLGETIMAHKDKDSDEKLTIGEMGIDQNNTEHVYHFTHHDLNKDGGLDLLELQVYESGMLQSEANLQYLFHMADADKDGNVTADEFGKITRAQLQEKGNLDHLKTWALHYDL
jgi:Ca2+-binding EF-hand superfamily protein